MDLSDHYQALMKQPQGGLSDADIKSLQAGYQFLFVKGFLGDLLPQGIDSYFSDQMAFLKQNAIDHLRLEPHSGFGTQNLPENNIVPIEKALARLCEQHPGKRLIIVTHSKGGVDTLQMLVSGVSDVKKQVAGWISIQAPFAGTPLADWATNNKISNWIIGSLLEKAFGGDKDSTNELRTDIRQKYLNEHSGDITALNGSIRMLNFASQISKTDLSIFMLQQTLIQLKTRQPNDGVLPQESQLLKVDGKPCCPFIRTKHIDHVYPVLRLKPADKPTEIGQQESKREKLFKALLKLWLDKKPD